MAVFRDHSSYYYQLPAAAAHRYDEKISVIGNVDPFIIDKIYFHDNVGNWPQVCYMDIVDYLVYNSFVTQEEMRAKKGLQSYRYFIDGMVQEVLCATMNGNALLRGKVKVVVVAPHRWWVIASCATYVCVSVKLLTYVYLYKVQLIGTDTIIVQEHKEFLQVTKMRCMVCVF